MKCEKEAVCDAWQKDKADYVVISKASVASDLCIKESDESDKESGVGDADHPIGKIWEEFSDGGKHLFLTGIIPDRSCYLDANYCGKEGEKDVVIAPG